MAPVLSIILPVHDTVRFLPQCLDSLSAQTLSDWELIAVDDCSSDGSTDVVKDFVRKDHRARLIRFTENKGVAAARNAGLDAANGAFVFFMDSDDWLDPGYLEAMLAHGRSSGLGMICNLNFMDHPEADTVNGTPHPLPDLPRQDGPCPVGPFQAKTWGCVWNKLFNRDFIERNGLRFPLIGGGADDMYFTRLAAMLQPEGYIFRGPWYHYRHREGSIMHARKRHALSCAMHSIALYEEYIRRGIPMQGISLFYAGPGIDLDTEEKYDTVAGFLRRIADHIKENPEYYCFSDKVLMTVARSCPDYASFRERYYPDFVKTYIMEQRGRSKTPKA